MNEDYQSLANSILVKFGTAPYEPNSSQLIAIISDINSLINQGIIPTDAQWLSIVQRHCPSTGQYKYSGLDNSDLNTLLKLAQNKLRK
jgi:hypothetical protein